ncbi:hypothetical protein E4K72_11245 [Oxalobacteraceae bacterium OM1]|nr:hypothetical protein E4K72_11245 [Oxalobacteraceae bacterium OM1]
MLFLKTTSAPLAPGVYAVDIAAKPPGKTYALYAAVDAADMPAPFITAMEGIGFRQTHAKPYTHSNGTKIVDLQFEKKGTDIFDGWTDAERAANLQAIESVLGGFNIKAAPRVMSLAEAFR